jgi:hypothetical protein
MSDTDVKAKQLTRILLYVHERGSINPKQAINDLGIMRLAARINDLEKVGINFDHNWVEDFNRYGEKIRYKEYRLAV